MLTQEKEPVGLNHNFIVGVGASAGGLDAFKRLIKSIPSDSGMSFVLVQHLDPNHESILSELIQKITLIPTHEVTDKCKIEPNNIYVIPSNTLLTVKDGFLQLADRSIAPHINLPIDLFFTSLAEGYESQAAGIVLSGTGKDGSLGLKAIKLHGGVTFAQDITAAFSEMPQHAIDLGVVDYVLSPEQIVHQLVELNTAVRESKPGKNNDEETQEEDNYFKQIVSLLDLQKGADFSYYKQTTIRRRIARRMLLKNQASIKDYYEYLKATPAEVDSLFQDILIPVTEFFRDVSPFHNLCAIYLPALLKTKKSNATFRVWCIGCSTGQEAYSIAICLSEFFSDQPDACKIQVFATDISETGIAQARSGHYSQSELSGVSEERLKKFFIKTESGYQVNRTIRDICVFATHNVLTNPPFASIDLISCRNVLIYMEAFLQRKAMTAFHYSLNEKGMLFLGKSESVGNSSDLFSSLSEADKVYSRNTVPGRFVTISSRRRVELITDENTHIAKDNRPNDEFQKRADEMTISQAPAGVIVNDHHDILQFRGSTGEWLESAPGKPTINVLKMAKHGLTVDLRNALHKVKTSKQPHIKKGIVLEEKSGVKKIITLEVHPILNTINTYYLILFKNSATVPLNKGIKSRGKSKLAMEESRAGELEKELSQTREDMRSITEDQEAGNEELLSANEELLSGSEELRSLNEELEISKEELQSTVEELSVANQELSFRNDELTYMRKYAEAIITTISEPLIVLTTELQIKSANAAFFKVFSLGEKETLGKHFYEIGAGQWDIPEFRNILEKMVLDTSAKDHDEVKKNLTQIGPRSFAVSARKIVSEANAEKLILLIIEDVTDRKNREQLIQSKAEYTKRVLDSSPIITFTASANGKMTYLNKFFLTYSGMTLEEFKDEGLAAVIHPDHQEEVTTSWMKSTATGNEFIKEMPLKRHDGVYRWHVSHALPIQEDGDITSWVCSSSDIHDQKMFADELEKQIRERTQSLKESNIELEHSNKNLEQFAFIASHDLQEPLRKIQIFSNILQESYQQYLSDPGKELVQKITSASARLSNLIQDVLNFSRIDHSENKFVKTDINQILSNVIQDFALLIDEKQAVVKADFLPTIEVIPIQINQLFYNLLSNSLKFAPPDSAPIIAITARQLSKVEVLKYPELNHYLSYFEILFVDNGIGFNEKYKEKIFEIFQRLHRQKEFHGTGIGLALCKKIVLNHHGHIFAESQEGVGTLFHIILPLNDNNRTNTEIAELMPEYAV